MTKPYIFDPTTDTIGLDRNWVASKLSQRPDPSIPVDGITFGIASMSENSPHDGERHPDGDEVLYLISGRVRVVFIDSSEEVIHVLPGDGRVDPKGRCHRVANLEPSQTV